MNVFNKVKINFNRKSTKLKIKTLTIVGMVLLMSACSKEPIKIGFSSDMTTNSSQLAIDARNGVEYYIRQVNEQGGVDGHLIELVVKDNEGKSDIAIKQHNNFVNEDVHFVIGNLLSEMAQPTLESNSEDLLFVSPSMSTNTLTGIDDYIIRTSPINNNQADLFIEYVNSNSVDELVIVYDLMNKSYSEDVAIEIEKGYKASELMISGMVPFDSNEDDLALVTKKIIELKPKNILLIAGSVDSAIMLQGLKSEIPDLGTYSVSWSMTNDFIQNGGKAVDGTIFVGMYYPEDNSDEFLTFQLGFEDYYGYKPTFISILAYDSISVLIKGMEEADNMTPESVKEAIISIGSFQGLQEEFYIDEFGDNSKQYMMFELVKDLFEPIRDWK